MIYIIIAEYILINFYLFNKIKINNIIINLKLLK